MMDLRRLRLLRELETRGTMSAVAEALRFTPSAVSQQIGRLEGETGLALIEKIGRGVRLTDAGRLLAAHAERILAAVDAAEADLEAQSRTVQGSLRVGAFPTAAFALMTPALELLAYEHPALTVGVIEVDAEQTLPAVRSGELDLVCEDEYEHAAMSDAFLDREDLLTERLRLVLPREDPLAAADEVSVADLADRPWAAGFPEDQYSVAVDRLCRERGGFAPRVLHRASDLMFLLSVVRVGRAVALLPDLLGAEQDERVVVRSIVGGDLTRTIYSVVRTGSARRPSVIALRRALAAVARTEDRASVRDVLLGPPLSRPAVESDASARRGPGRHHPEA
jgi:DNA-binding transcriptional LysR family regulator